ncbi:RNA 2',3'-cyclic phosphodiesterase [Candidatus Uhrbacteria bacterium CG10_big_fil_rev_8_21_14_0_10_50_16]|uniref:RNA 2',3'-cyclic phosphodiesterase n=1 Tax=Candidatus Uhrbacteria bacterium CG10_big_fil_rev_8_21_14_0_10_50_16 TaxID=1975039 RepID=A0A2H0RN87_9BACT|nr:MAG: RNA 2',3'-cyclic phosphodiesterase [Candidatus Uhrbacteria bacterium CG10_big_fil_rev_8_21_14_0_10_50_16]
MARLFLALNIGESAIPSFRVIQETLRRAIRDERVCWVPEQQFHITLQYLGDVSEDSTTQLVQALQMLQLPPISFTTWSLELLPHTNTPFSLTMRLADLTSAAFQTYTALSFVLNDLSLSAVVRPWRPHITLARMRSETRPFALDLKTIHSPQFTFWAHSLTLFESIPGPEVRYVPLATIDLQQS